MSKLENNSDDHLIKEIYIFKDCKYGEYEDVEQIIKISLIDKRLIVEAENGILLKVYGFKMYIYTKPADTFNAKYRTRYLLNNVIFKIEYMSATGMYFISIVDQIFNTKKAYVGLIGKLTFELESNSANNIVIESTGDSQCYLNFKNNPNSIKMINRGSTEFSLKANKANRVLIDSYGSAKYFLEIQEEINKLEIDSFGNDSINVSKCEIGNIHLSIIGNVSLDLSRAKIKGDFVYSDGVYPKFYPKYPEKVNKIDYSDHLKIKKSDQKK